MAHTTSTAAFPIIMKMIYAIRYDIDCYEISATGEESPPILWDHYKFEKIMLDFEQNADYYCSGTEIKLSIVRTEHENASLVTSVTKCIVEFIN